MFDRKPLGQQTEDDLTGGTYETQVFNMYAKLRGFHLTSGNTALAIHGMRSEDAEKGSTLPDGAATGKMFDDFEYLASNATHRFAYNSVTKAVDVKSPDTIKSYIGFVEDTYLVRQLSII